MRKIGALVLMVVMPADSAADPAWGADAALRDLEIANRAVARKRAVAARLADPAASTAARLELERLPYTTGQTWRLAAAIPELKLARKTSPNADLREPDAYRLRILRFTVVEAAGERARVEVREESGAGHGGAAARASRITIDAFRRVWSAEAFAPLAGLDLFPMSLPRLDETSGKPATVAPMLPGVLVRLAPEPRAFLDGGAFEFSAEDSLGRPMTVLWRRADPWPLYVSGDAGVSILLKEASR